MQAAQGIPPALRFGFQRQRYALTDAEPIFPRSETLKVLWVTSRPLNWEQPGGQAVLKPVQQEVEPRGVTIEMLASGSLIELYERLSAEAYHVVHLDMHGDIVKWADLKQRGSAAVKLNHREPLGDLRPWKGEKAVLLFSEGGPGSRMRFLRRANQLRQQGINWRRGIRRATGPKEIETESATPQ
jgi:hypothetical protein